MGAAADHIMCFDEKHASIISREQRRRAEAADARADDDCIVLCCSQGLAALAWRREWSQRLRAHAEQQC